MQSGIKRCKSLLEPAKPVLRIAFEGAAAPSNIPGAALTWFHRYEPGETLSLPRLLHAQKLRCAAIFVRAAGEKRFRPEYIQTGVRTNDAPACMKMA